MRGQCLERVLALATDYDGTLAQDGRVTAETVRALEGLRASGRKLVLVTGRELPDLQTVFPRLELFDRIVAENGALLVRGGLPRAENAQRTEAAAFEEVALAEPPPREFVERLRAAGCAPLGVGRVIVATREPHEAAVREAIAALRLDLEVILNKGAVMVLPRGVDKASGLAAALRELHIDPARCVAVGDAENDAAMLASCGCGVAVANALDSLREAADLVTQGARGKGVEELIARLLGGQDAQEPAATKAPPRHL